MRANYIKVLFIAWLILFCVVIWQRWNISSLKDANKSLTKQRDEQIAITADYEKRINSLHELDTKYTQELTHAKAEIDKLRAAVCSGAKRVYVKAKCPSTESSSTSRVDVGRSSTLERDAEQDYFNHLK